MQTLTDSQLARNVKNSDEESFKTFYYRYYENLYHYIWTKISSEEIAKELVQEIFYKFWDHRERIDVKKSIKSYLFSIAYNLVVDYSRRKKVRDNYINKELYN